MEDKLKDQVLKIVSEIFASKEDETIRQKTQDALQASADKLAELTTTLVEKDQLLAASVSELEVVKAEVEAIKAEKEAVAAEKALEVSSALEAKQALETELEKVSLELSTMKQELTAEARMIELTTAGVVREDASLQKTKVMIMSDEVFAAYKDELVSIKAQVLETLKIKASAVEKPEEVIPAKVDLEQSAQAALNMETATPQTLTSKYAELGQAMADAIKSK